MRPLEIVSPIFGLFLAACETETATSSAIDNGYAVDAGAPTVVVRGWWLSTYYPDPVPPGGSSAVQRSVPGSDFAYAVLAPGWDPASGQSPAVLIPVRSKARVNADRGEALHITVNDALFAGSCAANQPLSQDDADFITQRIFPGEFAGKVYDAKTCKLSSVPADAGASDASDGG